MNKARFRPERPVFGLRWRSRQRRRPARENVSASPGKWKSPNS